MIQIFTKCIKIKQNENIMIKHTIKLSISTCIYNHFKFHISVSNIICIGTIHYIKQCIYNFKLIDVRELIFIFNGYLITIFDDISRFSVCRFGYMIFKQKRHYLWPCNSIDHTPNFEEFLKPMYLYLDAYNNN